MAENTVVVIADKGRVVWNQDQHTLRPSQPTVSVDHLT